MNHKKIENKLLLFLDGDLDFNEKEKVRSHISACTICQTKINLIKNIWRGNPSKSVAPLYQWMKIKNRIESGDENFVVDYGFSSKLSLLIRSFAYSILIILTVYLGNLFGKAKVSEDTFAEQKEIKNQVMKDFFLDRLEPIPPESIGRFALFSNKESGEKR